MRDFEQQFKDAFERHSDELFRHASMRLSDRDRALELTQECFLRALEYAQRGGEIRELRPFLYRTLKNLIIDEYRKKKQYSLEDMIEGTDESSTEALLPPDESNTLEAAMDRFDGKRALAAMRELPEMYKEALTLRYVDGLSPKEIAHILGESENVVSVRIHRALRKLKDMLQKDDDKNQML